MDDVEIVDVDDNGVPQMEKVPENQDLNFLAQTVGGYLAQYGWYLLVVTVLACVLIQQLTKRRARQAQSTTPPEARHDPLSVARRQEALEASRRRMQEEHDAQAAIFREKQREQEEEKRKQKIEMWESMRAGKSYHGNARVSQATEEASSSTALKPKTNKKPLRSSDYNPLTGDGGGSCAWRPGRRGPSSGG